jgi:cation transport ATPase
MTRTEILATSAGSNVPGVTKVIHTINVNSAVVGIALLTFIVWITLVTPGTFEPALVASISVLVIAAIPTTIGTK